MPFCGHSADDLNIFFHFFRLSLLFLQSHELRHSTTSKYCTAEHYIENSGFQLSMSIYCSPSHSIMKTLVSPFRNAGIPQSNRRIYCKLLVVGCDYAVISEIREKRW